MTLESLWLFNHKPGPLSLRLSDPMVILKPQRTSRPLCRYCFQCFTPESNNRRSCGCHANMWGEDGYFMGRKGGEWTCCGARSLRAPHCSSKQHKSGTLMMNVRAISTKPMLVGDTPVQVFSELQISLFPSTKQTMEIQLTSDIASFINTYFFEVPEVVHQSSKDESSALLGSKISGTREPTRPDSSDEEDDIKARAAPVVVKTITSEYESTPIVYLKYCRIGEVDLEISTVGFGKKWGVALDREKVSLGTPAFHRSERIVTWGQLGAKYCKHVGTHLVTGRKKAVPVASSTIEEDDIQVDIDSPKSRLSAMTSMGSVTAVHKGVLGAASSMMKAKNQAKAVASSASSALGRKSTKNADNKKEALQMLFGAKR